MTVIRCEWSTAEPRRSPGSGDDESRAPRGPSIQHVLRRAVELGVDHIDTAQYYGPDVVNELIRDALHPYPAGLRLVSKVGAGRDARAGSSPRSIPMS
jgi:pyridoxine 4-dehydrogenase